MSHLEISVCFVKFVLSDGLAARGGSRCQAQQKSQVLFRCHLSLAFRVKCPRDHIVQALRQIEKAARGPLQSFTSLGVVVQHVLRGEGQQRNMKPGEEAICAVRGIINEHLDRGRILLLLRRVTEGEAMAESIHAFDEQRRHG
jgi:hypothetical protein